MTDSQGQTDTATASIQVNPYEQLAVYEPFDYPAGLLNAQSGSSEVGLTGAWHAHPTDSHVTLNSLTHANIPTKGGKFEATVGTNRWGGERSISSTALADRGLLKDGATLWFSTFAGYSSDASISNAKLALALANNGFSEDNYRFWIKDEGAQLGSGLGIVLNGSKTHAAHYRDLSQGNFLDGYVRGSWNSSMGMEFKNPGEYYFLVCRITWAEDPQMPDLIEVFQLLDGYELPDTPISVLEAVVDQSSFDTLTFTRANHVFFDEIRMGPTYQSVLLGNQPPPAPSFHNWANSHVGLTDSSALLDFDGGGIPTGIEWVLGGDPTDGSDDAAIAPSIDMSEPGFLSFTFRRADAAEADAGTSIAVEYCSDLNGWLQAVDNGANVFTTVHNDAAGAGIDVVEVRISRSLATRGKIFTRLKVSNP